MQKQESTAILSAIGGACLWGIVWYPINILDTFGVSGLWTTFLVFSLLSFASFPFLVLAYRKGSFSISMLPALVIMIFGGLTNLLFFLALSHTSVVRALMLFYLSPIWNLIASRVVKGFPMAPKKIVVIIISLSGTAILLGAHQLVVPYWNNGDTFALVSGLCFAISVIGLQVSTGAPSWVLTVIHWFGAAFLALLGIIIMSPPSPALGNSNLWLPVLVAFALGNQATASLLILYSLTKLESYRVNILMLLEIIIGTVTFALWSAEAITLNELTGICFILAASLLDNLSKSRHGPQLLWHSKAAGIVKK